MVELVREGYGNGWIALPFNISVLTTATVITITIAAIVIIIIIIMLTIK